MLFRSNCAGTGNAVKTAGRDKKTGEPTHFPIDAFNRIIQINLVGTFNLLEAARLGSKKVPVIFASTNKVYGSLGDLDLIELEDRYIPADETIRRLGIGEDRPLDLCTPYGCSKGAADQYVLDYARSFGLPAAVMRMSCIYGPRQMGTEDQGWVAHFLIRALSGDPITIYGDGNQTRSFCYVDDLVEGALKQQRLLATAPREITAEDLAGVFRGSMHHW